MVSKTIDESSNLSAPAFSTSLTLERDEVLNFVYSGKYAVIPNTVVALLNCILIIYLHRPNIQRLMNGTENKFGSKKEKQ